MTRQIEDIVAGGLCNGCGLCAGLSPQETSPIQMAESEAGYMRPVRAGEISAELAQSVDRLCPGLNIEHAEHSGISRHPKWGPLLDQSYGWSTDDALRQNASSGGGLSATIDYLLKSGEVDAIIQTGVAEDQPLRNSLYVSKNADQVFACAGSRYAPSSPLQNISDLIEDGRRFAFVGKPCDVAGLRALEREDPRVSDRIRFMFAFMCAGVPSYKGTDAVLSAMGVSDSDQVESFRYRGDGWPGFATAKLANGEKHRMTYDESWGGILNRHLQFRCKICPEGSGEFADLAFGDGWHIATGGGPSFEEAAGRSIVMVRTPKGQALFERVLAAGAMQSEPASLEDLDQIQQFQANRKGLALTRIAAMTSFAMKPPRFKNLGLVAGAKRIGVKASLKSYLGTMRRLLKQRKQA